MATNPKKITILNLVSDDQLSALSAGENITKGDDTLTPSLDMIYLTKDTSVSYEPQELTEAQKAQVRQNIGAGSASATTVLVNGVAQVSVSFSSDPQTQINSKVPTSRTIAGVDLVDNVTKTELLTAINVEDGAEVNDVTDFQVNGTSIVVNKVGNLVTNTAYNATTNKIATMSDLPSVPTTYVVSINGSSGEVTGIQTTSNLVVSISSSSTNDEYPSAKCVYDSIRDVQTKVLTDTSSTTKTQLLENNYEYNWGTLTSLTLSAISSALLTPGFISGFAFSSGSTATTFTDNASITWTGDNCSAGAFTPVASKRYNAVVWYDGVATQGVIRAS